MVDFLIPQIAAYTVALIFLIGFWQKISDIELFEISVDAYALLPQWALKGFTYGIVSLEATASLFLLRKETMQIGAILAIVLLIIVSVAIAINLLRGRNDIGCGCGGIEDEQKISWLLVIRNLIIIVFLMPVFLTTAERTLVLVDNLTLYLGALGIYGRYALANQIITNAPRLNKIQESP